MMHLVVWVTSKCNLHCPKCSQQYHMGDRTYELPLDEFKAVIDSLVARKISVNTIELTGGEPCMWTPIVDGLSYAGKLNCKRMLVTNGWHPEVIRETIEYLDRVVVSKTQCTELQYLEIASIARSKIDHVDHPHVSVPKMQHKNVLPAACCVTTSRWGEKVSNVMYFNHRLYYCCNAIDGSIRLGLNSDDVSVPFDEDIVGFMDSKDYMAPICSACPCNARLYGFL